MKETKCYLHRPKLHYINREHERKRKCEKTTKTTKQQQRNESSQRRQEAGGLEPRLILQTKRVTSHLNSGDDWEQEH